MDDSIQVGVYKDEEHGTVLELYKKKNKEEFFYTHSGYPGIQKPVQSINDWNPFKILYTNV